MRDAHTLTLKHTLHTHTRNIRTTTRTNTQNNAIHKNGASRQRKQVVVSDPIEIERIQKREADITKERITKILDAGANVILTTKGIDDLCLKYFVEAGAMGVRRCKKEDLKRIAKAIEKRRGPSTSP